MSIAERAAAVIPCLNEAASIAALVTQVRQYVSCVLVVDDGSGDRTAEVARAAGATVLRFAESRGKGAALKRGFQAARAMDFRWAIMMDGDGQHAPEEIPHLASRAKVTGAAMVVGNRMTAAQPMPAIRWWVNRWMSRTLSSYAGQVWPDSQCGFRLLDLDAWARFEFRAEHFEIESELLIRFAAAGFRIEFVPVRTRYAGEHSKIRPLQDSWRWFNWWREIKRELAGVPESEAGFAPAQISALPAK